MRNFYNLTITVLLTLFTIGSTLAQHNLGKISGKVTTSDGKAAPFVSVGLKETGKGTMSDEKGYYLINHIKPGSYTLKVTFIGLVPQEKTVNVTAGQVINSDFVLLENASQLQEVVIAGAHGQSRPVTVGKSGLRPLDVPQSVQVIDSTIITDQQANRLTDVIRNVNGVALGENRGSTTESFYARGYSLGSNNVFKNGARTALGGSLEASTLESVEVLKGSAALLYGSVTGGAVINLVTKKPKFYWGGEASMRTGSYNQYKPILDIYGPVAKNVAFRLITTKENANSYRDGVTSDRFYINPSLLFNVGKKTELVLQGDYLKSNYTPDFGIGTVAGQIPDVGRGAFVNTSWAYNHTKTGTAQANLTHRFNDVWKINVIGAYQSYFRNYFGAERPQAAAANGISPRALTRSQSQEYTFNQQINLTGGLQTGSIKHTLLIGTDADQSRVTSYGFKYGDAASSPTAFSYANFNILNPATYQTTLDKPFTRIYQNTFTPVYRMGAFVQDLIGLTDQFKLLAGIRYTWQKQPRANTFNEDTQTTTLANNGIGKAKVDKAFSPKLGLIYQPLKTTSLYASYANNFTSNSGVDIFGAPMGPSIIDQYEVGVKNDLLNGRLSVNVTAYRIINNRFAQTAQFQADGVTPNADANIREFSGKTSSDGIEMDVTGKLSNNVYFLAGYAYNFFRYISTLPNGITEGERIVGSVPHTANGTLFYTFSKGNLKGLKLGASGYYTGARNSGFNTLKTGAARGVPVHLNGYTTFDVSAGYAFRKFTLLGKVSNLTNELNYLVHENYSVNPIAPRMFSATASYRF
jgi:iron complex outermembrane recepter protein